MGFSAPFFDRVVFFDPTGSASVAAVGFSTLLFCLSDHLEQFGDRSDNQLYVSFAQSDQD